MVCRVGCWCTVAVLPLWTLNLPTGLVLQSAQNQLPGLQEPVGVVGCEQSYVHTDVEELHGGRRKHSGRSWGSAADIDGKKAIQCVGGG